MVYRKRPQRFQSADSAALAHALLTARWQVLLARTALTRDCTHDHALRSIVAAIDALAVMLKHLSDDLRQMDSDMSAAIRSPARSNRPSALENPYLLMGDLRTLREALRAAQDRIAVGGPMYAALDMVSASTAMAAALLTDDPDYWLDTATGADAAHRSTEHVKLARERGE
ncbi:MAG: hypothetical protein KDJ17_05070 [Hyphomicrobiaceae bacterium]|nr:hypothetical protein [Hyphomicrobiaceae bacterium]